MGSLEMFKKGLYIYGQNHSVERLPVSERYWRLSIKEKKRKTLMCNLN